MDVETLVRAQKGECDACRSLVQLYQKPVFSVLWRMLHPSGLEELVEDLAQETFLRTFKALGDFDPTGTAKLSTWILTIATRLAVNELRKQKPIIKPLGELVLLASEQADEVARQKELAAAVEQALAQLPPEQRAVFLLFEYHELSQNDIADVLGIKVGTVKSRLSRGRRQMNELLSRFSNGSIS